MCLPALEAESLLRMMLELCAYRTVGPHADNLCGAALSFCRDNMVTAADGRVFGLPVEAAVP